MCPRGGMNKIWQFTGYVLANLGLLPCRTKSEYDAVFRLGYKSYHHFGM